MHLTCCLSQFIATGWLDVFTILEKPILNSPYLYPQQALGAGLMGQPHQQIADSRRTAKFITPIPQPKKRKGKSEQAELDIADEVSGEEQKYHSAIINGVRAEVDKWRSIPNPNDWGVTPETARLLQHWRHHEFSGVRLCQVEAVETAIWLADHTTRGRMAKTFWTTFSVPTKKPTPD